MQNRTLFAAVLASVGFALPATAQEIFAAIA